MTAEELQKTHADYDAYIDEWTFFIRAYLGGKMYRDGEYLFKHPKESDSNYKRRKQIAFYYNFCAPIVDIFVSLLFKREPSRDYGTLKGDPLFSDFLADADLEGNSYEQFIREAQRFASAYGRVSILCDKPSFTATTQAEARALGIRPYLNLITPENVLDWSYVRLPNGRFVYDMVKLREGEDRYRIWTRYGWELWGLTQKKEAYLIESGEHNLGEVPLVNLYNKNSTTRMVGISDLQDIAYINRGIYNHCSSTYEITENTAFPMLAMPFDKGGEEEVEVGPKNIIQFDPDLANSKPFWLEAPHSSLAEIREWIAQDIRQIYKIANLAGVKISDESIQPASGIALEIENQQRNAVLSEKAANTEQFEQKVLSLYARWEGKDFDGKVKYSSDYDLKDIDQNTRAIIDILRDVDLHSEDFAKELEKKLVRNLLRSDLKTERRAEIYRSIENGEKTINDGGIQNG